jgi:hypothetical protein
MGAKLGLALLLLVGCASTVPVVQVSAQPLPPLPPAEASPTPDPSDPTHEESAKVFDFDGLDLSAKPAMRRPVTAAKPSCPSGTVLVAGSCLTPAAPVGAIANGCSLMINSIPQTHVLVDGVYVGPTPQIDLKRPAGAHTVMFITDDATMKKVLSASCVAGERKTVVTKMSP